MLPSTHGNNLNSKYIASMLLVQITIVLRARMATPKCAIWLGHMAWPYGLAIWLGHMAWPYGLAIWLGHMATIWHICSSFDRSNLTDKDVRKTTTIRLGA